MTSRQHTVAALILVLTGMYLMHLSSAEIQPWDEGLYAVRAKSIVEFNAWWDQTEYTLGGLYSSTAPPFVPWIVAASISILGPTAIAVRLPIVICSAIALWMMFLVARRMVTFEHSILAVCALAGTLQWVLFARQAMTEVPLMMWCLIALWSALVWGEGRRGWWPPVVFGVALGMACMTKMIVSLLPLLFLAPLIISRWKSGRFRLEIALALVVALGLAAPWYFMMANKYGASFLSGVPIGHVVNAVENNTRALGPLFYINQLVVGHALTAFALLYLAVAMVKRELLPLRSQHADVAVLAWFAASLLIFSIAATKHMHYTVMLLPSALLVGVYAAERFLLLANRRFVVVSYGLVSALAIWAMLPMTHRQAFRTSPFDSHVLVEGVIIGALAVVGFLIPGGYLQKLALQMFKPVVYGVVLLFIVRTGVTIVGKHDTGISGGRAVAATLLDTTTPTFTYLYHKRSEGDALNPQLAWYLNGWMSGWTRGKSYTPMSLPEDGVTDSVGVLGLQGNVVYIVYLHAVHPHTSRLLTRVTSALEPSYVGSEFDSYTLFKRRR